MFECLCTLACLDVKRWFCSIVNNLRGLSSGHCDVRHVWHTSMSHLISVCICMSMLGPAWLKERKQTVINIFTTVSNKLVIASGMVWICVYACTTLMHNQWRCLCFACVCLCYTPLVDILLFSFFYGWLGSKTHMHELQPLNQAILGFKL